MGHREYGRDGVPTYVVLKVRPCSSRSGNERDALQCDVVRAYLAEEIERRLASFSRVDQLGHFPGSDVVISESRMIGRDA